GVFRGVGQARERLWRWPGGAIGAGGGDGVASMSVAAMFEELCSLAREAALVESVEAALGWDERTYMPPAAGEYRAEQMTYLTGVAHQKRTSKRLGELLDELLAGELMKEPHSDAATTIRELKRQYDKRVKLPQSLVEELT